MMSYVHSSYHMLCNDAYGQLANFISPIGKSTFHFAYSTSGELMNSRR
jgi:hypothetical protein